MSNPKQEERLANVMERYQKDFEGDQHVMIYQIIFDLLEWCDQNSEDFDCTVAEVREDYNQVFTK